MSVHGGFHGGKVKHVVLFSFWSHIVSAATTGPVKEIVTVLRQPYAARLFIT